jgi:hypothetical protein
MVLNNWKLVLDVEDVLRAQGANPTIILARRPLLVDLAEQALVEGTPLLQPVVHYQQFSVDELCHHRLSLIGGGSLCGDLVAQVLASATQVVVIGCTIGSKLEEHSAKVMAHDLKYGLALNGVGSAAMEALGKAVCHFINELAALQGLKASMPISPGLTGWPVHEGQSQLFNLIDFAEISIRLMPSGMMHPLKSLTMVIGLGLDVSESGTQCDFCALRERCQHRSI